MSKNKAFRPFILTLDDDEDFNRLLVKTLQKVELDVETTTESETFFQQLKHTNPSIVIVDLNLGEKLGAGLQVIEHIRRERGESLPIIVMTRRSSPEDISLAFELGASDYITKPLDDLLLISKIKQFIRIRDGKAVLTKDDDFFLPFKQIPLGRRKCSFEVSLRITEISEYGVKFEGDHFFARGSSLKIQCPLFTEIFGEDRAYLFVVHNNWVDKDAEICGIFVEFDASNENMMAKLRQWLSNRKAQEKSS
ncbi:MAG: response regulator transcription factor [Bdellovibrio sp.]|nr:response regulator transcription factor [Bdellovibrio sp.]